VKEFKELNITTNNYYNCSKISITDLVNCKIIILGFQKTEIKERKPYVVNFKYIDNGKEGKFFTTSSAIKNILDQVKKEDFPFATMIKQINGKYYTFI
jgi:hypothetical protein